MPNIAERENGVPTDSAGLRHHGTNHIRRSPAFGMVTKGVPANTLLDIGSERRRSHLLPQDRLATARPSPSMQTACKYTIVRFLAATAFSPLQQSIGKQWMNRHRHL
jgi:hypothetical protein